MKINEIASKLLPECQDEALAISESWWMLEKLTGKKQAELSAKSINLSREQEKTLQEWIRQRVEEHKPLQYILGTVPFCGLEIFVEPPILIPRPETEEWCDWLLQKLEVVKEDQLQILDIGAGSGCITLAIAKALPYATVIGVDINPNAIKLCEKNKKHNNITNALFIKSDLYSELSQYKGAIDLIVSNPPYISQEEFAMLQPSVTNWEDKTALVAHNKGFVLHKKIIDEAPLYLKKGGILVTSLPQILIEFGKGQEETMKEILSNAGFKSISIHSDMEDVPRWATSRL